MTTVFDILQLVAVVVAGFGILCTLLPLIPTTIWWIRDMGFPRIQLTLFLSASAVPLLVPPYDMPFRAGLGGLALLCAAWQLYRIFPYTGIAPTESKDAERNDKNRRLTIMVSNVLMTNRNVDGLLDLVADYDPDILLAVETDDWWVAEIGGSLRQTHPYQVRRPQENTYGMILCSRLKLSDIQVRFLVEDDIPSILCRVRLTSGNVFSLYALHPRPPVPATDTDERDAELLIVGKMVRKKEEPAIVFGDLNDVAWSETTRMFQNISGMLDPRKGRGTFSTFHARYPILRYPLDHIFHTSDFRLVMMERLPGFGSDHFPIIARFSYEPECRNEMERPEADHEEREEAEEKIGNGLAEARLTNSRPINAHI